MNRSIQLAQVRAFYRTLSEAWGPQHWWPAEGQLEVIVGAYLTQNTSWKNVERALANLRSGGVLNLPRLRAIPVTELEELIRPAGYFRQKAEKLKVFLNYLFARYGGSLEEMFAQPTTKLREELLELKGVGPETADSILLYAANRPVFVVDAYTRRIAERHGIVPPTAQYDEIRALFEEALRADPVEKSLQALEVRGGAAHEPSLMSEAPRSGLAQGLNEMHALIVGVGKNFCFKTAPSCECCPLQPFLGDQVQSAAGETIPERRASVRRPDKALRQI